MKTHIVNKTTTTLPLEVIDKVFVKASNLLQLAPYTVTVILVHNNEIQSLNQQFRNIDKVTDVLTFPDGSMHHLGDIFISVERCESQASEYGHSIARELGFLAVHGLLHTLGYDHQTDEEEKEMFDLQETILQKAKLYR